MMSSLMLRFGCTKKEDLSIRLIIFKIVIFVKIRLFRITNIFSGMCTGQICESNTRNVLLGDPFKTDK